MNAHPIDISIIIVTWNGKQFAWECLESLRIYKDDPEVEIIVVDNASTDGTAELVEQDFPWARMIRNSSNLGFAKANNIGMAASMGKFVCLVNSDVKVPPDCIQKMRKYMDITTSVGMIGPQMLSPNGRIERSYMRFPTVWRSFCNALGLHRIFRTSRILSGIMMPDFNNSQTAEVDVLNGWFLMVRRRALDEVGKLDERFHMYGEDIDWSIRFCKAGWKRAYYSGACAFHYGGASSAIAPTRLYIEMNRANLQLFRKHYGSPGHLAALAVNCLHELVRLAGYSLLGMSSKSQRSRALLKVKRSLACIQWLIFHGYESGAKIV